MQNIDEKLIEHITNVYFQFQKNKNVHGSQSRDVVAAELTAIYFAQKTEEASKPPLMGPSVR